MKKGTRKGFGVVTFLISTAFMMLCLSTNLFAGWVQQAGPGSWNSWVKKAHADHPVLAKKLDGLVMKMNRLQREVKAARCRTCNNAAGTLENARAEMEQIYYVLAGKQPCNANKVKRIYKSFNNYENRMKWRFPKNPMGQAWYKRWTDIKAEFNALQPEIIAAIK